MVKRSQYPDDSKPDSKAEGFPPRLIDTDNPAFHVVGQRFFVDQGPAELMQEFMLMLRATFYVGTDGRDVVGGVLSEAVLDAISKADGDTDISYSGSFHLATKLLALYSTMPADKKCDAHRDGFQRMSAHLEDSVLGGEAKDVQFIVAELIRSFRASGGNRMWCAQTLQAVDESLLGMEVIWNESVSRKMPSGMSWLDAIGLGEHGDSSTLNKLWTVNRHRFIARGGELLFLQLCLILTSPNVPLEWHIAKMGTDANEQDLGYLRLSLQKKLPELFGQVPALSELVKFIENLMPEFKEQFDDNSDTRVNIGCCRRESELEAYLFAVELNRLLGCQITHSRKITLLSTLLMMQSFRTICARCAKVMDKNPPVHAVLPYVWLIGPEQNCSEILKHASRDSVRWIQKLLTDSMYIAYTPSSDAAVHTTNIVNEAVTKYTWGYIQKHAKVMGIIVPRTGPGSRWVMTEELLQFFVCVLLRPGESVDLPDFLDRLWKHYGIAACSEHLDEGAHYINYVKHKLASSESCSWISEMLRAGGFLTELSDAISIVHNPFGSKGQNE